MDCRFSATQDRTSLKWFRRLFAALLLVATSPAIAQTDLTAGNALIDAAAIGNADVVENLLRRGARVDASDERGRTPLIFGAFNGSVRIVDLTLSLGAKVDRQDRGGNSALIWAANRGHLEVVERLIAAPDLHAGHLVHVC